MNSCIHCDEIAFTPLFNDHDVEKLNPFCCYGCLTVYNVIHEKGLESYYEIKKNAAFFKRRSPVDFQNIKYKYLDDPEFIDQYSYLSSHQEKTMEFYLEGIHCLACLWLIEKIPEFLPTVRSSKLDLERSVVTVILKPSGKFSEVAQEFSHLGYRPHPLNKNQEAVVFKNREERKSLIRIGVAGAAAGNIMIYAVSLYGGASDGFAQLFNALTVIFAIPVLTYSAFPFYKNAWSAIKNRTLSIDIPISIALIMGAVMGFYNLFSGIPENYFDSLTTLVFLLLLSRYFLQKIQEKGLSAQDLHFFYQSESVLKSTSDDDSNFTEIHPKFIKLGDVLKVQAGEFIPADGLVIAGVSNINNSLLTGESLPVKVKEGEKVYSGTQNLDHDLIIKVEKTQHESRIGSILKNVEDGWSHRSKIVDLTSRVSKYFTLAVFILSASLFVYVYQTKDMTHALEQALTLLIVTCPCALALATPLTFTRALAKASEQGIIIKSDEVLEKISKVKTVFLDKTGTVTYGKLKVVNLLTLTKPSLPVEDIIFHLEKNSSHPVAKALMELTQGIFISKKQVNDFQETLGKGVSGRIENHFYEINKNGIFEDHNLIATFEVQDVIRTDSLNALEKIKNHGVAIQLLSGDSSRVVNSIAAELNLTKEEVLAEVSPEEKGELIAKTPNAMMVGDGANDAIALTQASVGVAVLGSMDISLRAADVYLTVPGLVSVEKLMILSQETMKVIHRNLILSLGYNSVSVVAAFMGYISPLVAAIIMPLSSLTVLISTIIGTKKTRQLWK